MHPTSREVIGQILAPTGGPPPAPALASTRMTIEQIIRPTGAPAAGAPAPVAVVAEVATPPAAVVPPPRP